MILVDTALKQRAAEGRPIRVGMIGAGFMGRGVANQIINYTEGMELVAVSNRRLEGAVRAYAEAGVDETATVSDAAGVSDAVRRGVPAVTEDPFALVDAEGIDVLCDVTGAVEFGARVTLAAFAAGKHMVTMNAELDGTVGPLLKVLAEQAGVIFSGVDGDQPGVEVNLFRFVTQLGLTPLVMGNIKGLQDPYRNPTTQEGFAKQWGQDPAMVTSFADGTKVSFEQAIVANATGMTVAKRGMGGADHRGHVDELTTAYDVEELKKLGGVVDYVVGAKPGPGVFCLATVEDPKQRHMLNLYKLGEGPLYSFYTPYHLCHFEVPTSLARAVLFGDAPIVAAGAPQVEVVATAKVDLKAGQVLDGLGEYHTYGEAEAADVTARERLLPMGVAEGCTLVRDVPKDATLTYDDVIVPEGRLIDDLRRRQAEHFGA
ncbi:putative homoserine dehydrogenase-like protein [Motilibacter rhizosphaerae]|uniref:Putative homoserine dehydrogenase-like protein n=1 Tax=Motilibacter rhizosphaerae TaxID=598652 RepID=A0A4Q7NRY4_9ACTN|nr:Gfo/Idh/MocA family oxidoreductase [Motilibacter rhizosphaerae]RZS87410.1 putative homoserine dehydrogenase-like protein [Motilibacter rhizosphaerae]